MKVLKKMKFLSGNLFRRNVVEEMQTDSADDCQVNSKFKLLCRLIISTPQISTFLIISTFFSDQTNQKSISSFNFKNEKYLIFHKIKFELIGTSTFLVILSPK